MSSDGVVSGASGVLSGTKNILTKAAPWIGLLVGVIVGGWLVSMVYSAIFYTAGVENVLKNYIKDLPMLQRVEWGISAGIMAAVGIAVYRMMNNAIGHVIGMFFIGAGLRGALNMLLGTEGPYNPNGGA